MHRIMHRTSRPVIVKVCEKDGINKDALKESEFYRGKIVINTAGADRYAYWIAPTGERLCYLTNSQVDQLRRLGVEEFNRPTNNDLNDLVRLFRKVAPHYDLLDWLNKQVDAVKEEYQKGKYQINCSEEDEENEEYYFDIETNVFANTYFIKGTSRDRKHEIVLSVRLTSDHNNINRVEVLYGNQMFYSPLTESTQAEIIRFPLSAALHKLTQLRDENPGTMGMEVLASFFDAVEEEFDEDNDNETPFVVSRIGSEVRIEIDYV